jgi:hypothetical protein
MMLNLYSQFMNAGAGVSIDWQQQFRAIVRALAIFCVDDPFLRDKFFVSVGGRDTRYLGELYEIERKRALSLPVPVAGVQYNTELLAAAAAKMKIADHRHTPGLLYVSDRFNQNSERFASCVQSVASLFDDGSASGGSRCSEQSLELFADTLCLYFDRLVESVPLIKKGLSIFCSAIFDRTNKILRDGGVRCKNAERVCKVATCLFDSNSESCGNRAFRKDWTGFKNLSVNDFVIEVIDVQDFAEVQEAGPGGGFDDAKPADGVAACALDFDVDVHTPIFKKSTDFRDFVDSLVKTQPFGLYHRILAHDGLDHVEWRCRINAIKRVAQDAVAVFPEAIVCLLMR